MVSIANKTLVALLAVAFLVSVVSSLYTFSDGSDVTAAAVSEEEEEGDLHDRGDFDPEELREELEERAISGSHLN